MQRRKAGEYFFRLLCYDDNDNDLNGEGGEW